MKLNNDILPMEKVLRILFYVLDEIKKMDDVDRARPVNWMIMHMVSCCQLTKLFAMKRGIDPELAAITAALHDVGVVYTNKVQDHDKKAEPFVRDIIQKFNNDFGKDLEPITKEDEESIVGAIIDHGNKAENSGNALAELLKDIDSVERLLNGLDPEENQIRRAKEFCSELGIKLD